MDDGGYALPYANEYLTALADHLLPSRSLLWVRARPAGASFPPFPASDGESVAPSDTPPYARGSPLTASAPRVGPHGPLKDGAEFGSAHPRRPTLTPPPCHLRTRLTFLALIPARQHSDLFPISRSCSGGRRIGSSATWCSLSTRQLTILRLPVCPPSFLLTFSTEPSGNSAVYTVLFYSPGDLVYRILDFLFPVIDLILIPADAASRTFASTVAGVDFVRHSQRTKGSTLAALLAGTLAGCGGGIVAGKRSTPPAGIWRAAFLCLQPNPLSQRQTL
ncbi:MAG: hypothetical protein BJ554DRAFT_1503 [Olpidium bornovanus]|uniref:Uncharacterized protein n=1 Tax=Olpidium bornovanus TaxID=278681 RepID=A0A8H8DLX2_9FUNG|nr:MAG: hypothetical protein BJ554DRAFT_1503 [Olpidium bornovanus]